jgi:hypothetical protein
MLRHLLLEGNSLVFVHWARRAFRVPLDYVPHISQMEEEALDRTLEAAMNLSY